MFSAGSAGGGAHPGPARRAERQERAIRTEATRTDPPAPAEPNPSAAAARRAGPPVLAPETQRLYAGDWARFQTWCRATGQRALPATPDTVAAFLATGTLSPGTRRRRLAAIVARHRQYALAAPVDAGVRAALRASAASASSAAGASGIAGKGTGPADRRIAFFPSDLARMAQICPADLAGWRDRTLLLLAAAGIEAGHDPALGRTGIGRIGLGRTGRSPAAFGRAALVGLDAEDIRFTDAGVELTLRDRAVSRTVQLRRDPGFCPVRALETWLRLSDTAFGPVFRKIDRWGNLEHRRLGADALRRIFARRAMPAPPVPGKQR